jgi:hypothetical protein
LRTWSIWFATSASVAFGSTWAARQASPSFFTRRCRVDASVAAAVPPSASSSALTAADTNELTNGP